VIRTYEDLRAQEALIKALIKKWRLEEEAKDTASESRND